VQKLYLAIWCRNDFLEEAMFLGISFALLLLPGGSVASATPLDGYLVEYPIYVLDEWDMGGGGSGSVKKYRNCDPKYGIGPAQMAVVKCIRANCKTSVLQFQRSW
jgi:hypothetical protein